MTTVAVETETVKEEPEIVDDPRTMYGLWNEYQYSDNIHKVVLIGKKMTDSGSCFVTADRWRAAAKQGRDFLLQFDTSRGTISVQDKSIEYMMFYVKSGVEVYFRHGKKWRLLGGKEALLKAMKGAFPDKEPMPVSNDPLPIPLAAVGISEDTFCAS